MSGRYIDADAYRKKWADIFDSAYGDSCCEMFKKSIDEQPTADVVEVVRCRDCIDWEFRDGWDHCRFFDWLLEDDNGYCHFGERREEVEDE